MTRVRKIDDVSKNDVVEIFLIQNQTSIVIL